MKRSSIIKVILLALVICLVVIIGGFFVFSFLADKLASIDPNSLNNRGLYGDSWGGVNAIASALAFAGVIVTLYLQNRDLNLQRDEMRLQREEFMQENETLKYQRFENLFYNMLNLQQKIVEGLRYEYEYEEYTTVPLERGGMVKDKRIKRQSVVGRDVFRYLFENVPLTYKMQDNRQEINGYRQYLFHEGFANYDSTLIPTYFDHYFRHLYKIVKFVDSQSFSFEESYKYMSFLRGTLSRHELVWLYYNTLRPNHIGFKGLIEKYSLLKGIRSDLLTRSQEVEQYYADLCITYDERKEKGYISDFEFYLTDKHGEMRKYDVSAFWSPNDREYGLSHLKAWQEFVTRGQVASDHS